VVVVVANLHFDSIPVGSMVADDIFPGAMRCVGMAAFRTKQTETRSSVIRPEALLRLPDLSGLVAFNGFHE
jgi:hypothetical protein